MPNEEKTNIAAPGEGASPFKGKTGWRRIWNALHYSKDGLRAAYANEDAFRLESWLAVVMVAIAAFLPVGLLARALLIASVLMVLVLELINSAIEAAIDRIGLERHELSKRAKDAGSAAVLVALVITGVVWGCVLWDWLAK